MPVDAIFSAHLNVILGFQLGINSQPIPAVIDDPFALLALKPLDLPYLAIVGVDVVELHLQRRMLFDEEDGLYVPVFKSFLVADIQHRHQRQDCNKQ